MVPGPRWLCLHLRCRERGMLPGKPSLPRVQVRESCPDPQGHFTKPLAPGTWRRGCGNTA